MQVHDLYEVKSLKAHLMCKWLIDGLAGLMIDGRIPQPSRGMAIFATWIAALVTLVRNDRIKKCGSPAFAVMTVFGVAKLPRRLQLLAMTYKPL